MRPIISESVYLKALREVHQTAHCSDEVSVFVPESVPGEKYVELRFKRRRDDFITGMSYWKLAIEIILIPDPV